MSHGPAIRLPVGRASHVGALGLGVILALGLTACVEVQPVPTGNVGSSYYQSGYPQSGYPQLVQIPGYPVYYDPYARANYFFYDGLYWMYRNDNWYASSWYAGPWGMVGRQYVPYYLLRVPVRYYRAPPPYFRGLAANDPPHWGDYWGRDWQERHRDWNHWTRNSVPPPAPVPDYQRNYAGDRYPHQVEQQQVIRDENYRYAPRDDMTRRQYGTPARQDGQSQEAHEHHQSPSVSSAPTAPQDQAPRQHNGWRAQPQAPAEPNKRPAPDQDEDTTEPKSD